jgi:preprotein translocase subunit SecE
MLARSLKIRIGRQKGSFENRQESMAKFSPFKFMQEVRAETEKVTWPSRRETAITTAMVFVMVAVSSIFFLLADQAIRLFITTILTMVR